MVLVERCSAVRNYGYIARNPQKAIRYHVDEEDKCVNLHLAPKGGCPHLLQAPAQAGYTAAKELLALAESMPYGNGLVGMKKTAVTNDSCDN